MTKLITIIALLIACPAFAQNIASPPKGPMTDREQVQSDRAKATADEKTAPTARPWDRDADGKRPWERKGPSK